MGKKKESEFVQDEYLPHQVCPRCRLNLSQDVCVCGWRRPPRPKGAKKQNDLVWKAVAGAIVLAVLGWLTSQVTLAN